MKRPLASLALLAVCATSLASSGLAATSRGVAQDGAVQEPAQERRAPRVPGTLAGAWRCTVSAERARAIALAAFAPRVQALPAFVRPMVSGRLEERIRPTMRMEIALEADRVRVTNLDPERVVVETALGGSTRVRGADGEVRRVTQRLSGGWLEQVFEGENGIVHRLLSTEPDGQTLHADVTVHNERLGAPVRWRLDYRR